jgi:hypothetical protein
MKLLDPGQAPRRKLRYEWRLGQKEQLTMGLRTSASTPSQIADGMRAEVAAIEDLSGSAVVTSRGLTREISLRPGATTDTDATGQMVEQIRQTLRDLAAPLPEEDVGRGARWQKLSRLDSEVATSGSRADSGRAGDPRIAQTETFTLVEVPGDAGRGGRGALDDVLAQTAPSQALRAPGVQGSAARMESMLASGSARVRFELSRLVPQTAFDGTTTMILSGPASSDSARRFTMIMRVRIDIQGTTR